MNDLFHGFEFICVYIYDILILTKGNCTDHIQKLESTFNKLKKKELNAILKGILLLLLLERPPCPDDMRILVRWCSTRYIEAKETLDFIP